MAKSISKIYVLLKNSRCSLFLVQGEVGTDTHCLISNLFDVSSSSTVEEMNRKSEIRISWGSGIVGHVAATGVAVNITDCYEDKRFNQVRPGVNFIKTKGRCLKCQIVTFNCPKLHLTFRKFHKTLLAFKMPKCGSFITNIAF